MWNQIGQSIGMERQRLESTYLQALNFYQIETGRYTETRKMVILK